MCYGPTFVTPSGARCTCSNRSADHHGGLRLHMQDWGEKYSMILWRSSIHCYLTPKNYVDDVRQGTDHIEKGKRYDEKEDAIVYREEWRIEDERENLTDLKRIGNVCLTAMNSVAEDLEFTVETEEDFANKRLQTLDFKAWFDVQEGIVKHDFFEKPMRPPLVVMERSAMDIQQKHSMRWMKG